MIPQETSFGTKTQTHLMLLKGAMLSSVTYCFWKLKSLLARVINFIAVLWSCWEHFAWVKFFQVGPDMHNMMFVIDFKFRRVGFM